MSTATYTFYSDPRESLRGTIWLSMALHGLLFLAIGFYTVLGPKHGARWGGGGSGGSAVKVNAVASLPNIPLPSPELATPNTVANQNPGLHQTEPPPKPKPMPEAEEIPKFKDSVKPEKTQRIAKRIQQPPPEMPDNAVPFGLGGQPSPSTLAFSNAGGEGGLSFGEGNFRDRYSWYVEAVKNRVSSNWLQSTISPTLTTAPRVYITFDILRDGSVTGVQIEKSSGVPEVDRSALRAVLASNPLGALPRDYPGDRVSVRFYFDFHR